MIAQHAVPTIAPATRRVRSTLSPHRCARRHRARHGRRAGRQRTASVTPRTGRAPRALSRRGRRARWSNRRAGVIDGGPRSRPGSERYGTLAHAARLRRGGDDGAHLWHGDGGDPALASHRLSRGVLNTPPTAADRRLHVFRSRDEERGAVRRGLAGVHAESARRGHTNIGRSDPARHLGELRRQRAHRALARRGRAAAASVGSRMRKATRRAIPPCFFASRRARSCRLGASRPATRATRSPCSSKRPPARWQGTGAPIRRMAGAQRCSCRCSILRRSAARTTSRGQMDWLAKACHDATPRSGSAPVRLPGEHGLRRYRDQQARGVVLFEGIVPSLAPWAEKLRVAIPRSMS